MNFVAEKTYLGIELGSTRIKGVLIGENHEPLASGGYEWENKLENGIWTYSMDDAWQGLQACYRELADDVQQKYGVQLSTVGAIGISGMMHGYLPLDANENQLTPFRTWRNTMTEKATIELSELFQFNIPQRWCVAHLYQSILDGAEHVKDIAFLTTLAGYIHYKLTGQNVVGVGEASGMFPIDSKTNDFNEKMIEQFEQLTSGADLKHLLKEIFPKVLGAGEDAGTLTQQGALLIDPSGTLQAGIPFCPPEGDAGTGMVATNSVAIRTGNISAGTSGFAMIVLEKELSKMYREIDMVTTPAGKPVAMVHCNNFTPDLDAWIKVLNETLDAFGVQIDKNTLYGTLYKKALEGDADSGGLLAYNFFSGEHIIGTEEGRPMIVRTPDSKFTLANFMRTMLYATMGTIKLGMDILTEKEQVRLESMLGHGGFFKTKGVGQKLMAGALNVPVTVMESAGEGGAWGIALLAAFRARKSDGETLEDYLAKQVFGSNKGNTLQPDPKDVAGFEAFMQRFKAGLDAERAAIKNLQ